MDPIGMFAIISTSAGIIAAYFAPTIVAAFRHKRDTLAIGALNMFLGWSVIGWVIALVWACRSDD